MFIASSGILESLPIFDCKVGMVGVQRRSDAIIFTLHISLKCVYDEESRQDKHLRSIASVAT